MRADKEERLASNIEKVIEHIKKNYDGSELGIAVTTKEIMEMCSCTSAFACEISKALQTSNKLILGHDPLRWRNNFYKPAKEETVQVEEEKPSEVTTLNSEQDKKYRYLTEAQVELAKSRLSIAPKDQLDSIMMMVNCLAKLGALQCSVSNYAEKVSDLLAIRVKKVHITSEILISNKIACGTYKDINLMPLVYPNREFSGKMERTNTSFHIDKPENETISPVEPVKECVEKSEHISIEDVEAQVKATLNNFAEEAQKEVIKEPVDNDIKEIDTTSVIPAAVPAENVSETNKQDFSELLNGMKGFAHIIGQFKEFVDSSLDNVQLTNEVKVEYQTLRVQNLKYKKELNDGNITIEKALNEISELKDTIRDKDEEIRRCNKTVHAYKEATDNVYTTVQSRFEVLLADISSSIRELSNMKAWDMTPATINNVQDKIISAVTAAIDDINNANTNVKSYHDKI
jgi:hypothetical protein